MPEELYIWETVGLSKIWCARRVLLTEYLELGEMFSGQLYVGRRLSNSKVTKMCAIMMFGCGTA